MARSKLTELDLARQIRDAARALGWRHIHFRPAMTSKGYRTPFSGDAGFPDMVLARRGRVIFAELKRDGEHPRSEQLAWLEAIDPADELERVGPEAYVWHPSDFERIVELLR